MTPILDQSWTLGRHWFTSDGMILQEWLCGPHTRLRVTNFLPSPRGYDWTFNLRPGVSDCAEVVSNFCELNDWTLTGSAGPATCEEI